MRKILVLAGISLMQIHAAEWTGYISDAACGWNNARPGKEAKECAQKCVGAGWDPVFVEDGQMDVRKIRDKQKVLAFVGDHVAISGKLEGTAISVSRIRRVAIKAAPRAAGAR